MPNGFQSSLWSNTESVGIFARLLDIIPDPYEPLVAQINAITRLLFYFTILCALSGHTRIAIITTAFAILATIVAHRTALKELRESYDVNPLDILKGIENSKSGKCVLPTRENPMMNPLAGDPDGQRIFHDRPACSSTVPFIKEQSERLAMLPVNNVELPDDIFMDMDDVFDKKNSARRFNTLPSTQIPNDQDAFAKWLYPLKSGKPHGGKYDESARTVLTSNK